MKLILTGILENIRTRQDGSVTVNFTTQEMDAAQGGQLFQLRGKYCKCLLSDSEITELEANLVDAEKIEGTRKKSQSQRLRAVLYRVWEQAALPVEFDQWYHSETEKIIEHYRAKLEP